MKFCKAIVLLNMLLVPVAYAAAPPIVALEEAAEITQLRIQQQAADRAVVYGRMCDYCETLRLTIDADTTILRRGNRLNLTQATQLRSGATVLFDPASRRVTRVIFWN
ncbi:MAG: hypothetical protein KJO55_03915 [Gammaproteobacteria bacterium]|nr:hypothetical protein [Gammaproteobacteria bacterium]NND60086.1 hypothetical protein [Gammaproteobacteria bacterium]